jgi:phage tail-like protein
MNKSTGSYTISLLGPFGPARLVGSFSGASGIFLTQDHIQKIAGIHKAGDVTLKRGVVDSSCLWNWFSQVRHSGDVIITRLGTANHPIQAWRLRNAKPKKYTGPPLGGKGGDVAMEELVLSAEAIEIVPPR